MKERPILMNAFSVNAILEGRKTQTRRVIKPQPILGRPWKNWVIDPEEMDLPTSYSPYGIRTEKLWVRETWSTPGNFDDIKPSELPLSHFDKSLIAYRATEPHGDVYYKWRPSIFMPRWASRITLEVTDVRIERVQDISDEDAKAEGVKGTYTNRSGGPSPWWYDYRDSFKRLWDEINKKRGYGWDANPWCFVVTFERIE